MTNPGFNQHDNDTFEDYRGHIVLPSNGPRGSAGGGGGVGADGLNTPSKPSQHQQLGPNTQAGRRWQANIYDHHKTGPGGRFPQGRPWNGPMELSANPDLREAPGFVAPLSQGLYVDDEAGNVDRRATFASVWSAPWTPVEKFFVFDYKRMRLTFAYQRMINEEQQAMDTYYEAAAKLGAGKEILIEPGVIPPYAITGVIGSPYSYIRNIKLARAALAGDPWLLGFIDEPNGELAKLLGYNERTGLRMMSYTPEKKAPVTPDAVLSTPPQDLAAMIADAVQKALEAERAAVASKPRTRPSRAKPRTTPLASSVSPGVSA
jgi:hypothetical protein